jgi:hypothetical protein
MGSYVLLIEGEAVDIYEVESRLPFQQLSSGRRGRP